MEHRSRAGYKKDLEINLFLVTAPGRKGHLGEGDKIMSGYETKKTPDGRIELWYVGEKAKTLHGVYESEEELKAYQERIQKQEERAQFLTHTNKKGKKPHGDVRGPETDG